MNPRYLIYCQINGNTPKQQEEIDREKFKGGQMLGFINFIQNHISIFKKLNPEAFAYGGLVDHMAFDEYLKNIEPA